MLFCLSDHPPLPLVFLVDAEPDGRQITLKLLTMEYCMTQDLSATKDRVAQALYVLGGLASLAMLLMFAGFLVAIVNSMQNDGRYFRYEIERAMFSIFWASLAYGLGWGIRWIINGTTTSVIDYLRDPKRFTDNAFLMVSLAVLALFAIVLPYLGITKTVGTFETQFAEGLGAGIAVLLLSCLGLLYKSDRSLGFVVAALGFSLLFLVSRVYSPL